MNIDRPRSLEGLGPDTTGGGSPPGRRAAIVAVILVCGLVELVAYFSVAPGGREWVYNTGSLLFLSVMMVGVLRFRSTTRSAWLLLVAGQGCALAGDFLWSYYEQVLGIAAPYPALPDVLYLLSYPFMTAGVVLLQRRMLRGAGVASLLDGLIITTSAGLWVWVFLVTPAVGGQDLSLAERTASSAYPLADLLLLAVLVVFSLRSRRPNGSLALIGLALVVTLISDVVYGFQALSDGYTTGDPIDAGWLLAYVFLAAAPFWPDDEGPIDERSERLTTRRLVALAAAASLAPGIVVRQEMVGGHIPILAGAFVSAVLFSLAIARLALFNRDLDRAKAGLEASQRDLTITLGDLELAQHDRRLLLDRISRAAEEQRTQLAAELHDRPIQHLTAISFRVQRASRSLERDDVDTAKGLLDEVASSVSSQVEELRTLMTELRPPILDERGLVGALTDRAAAVNLRHGPSVEVTGQIDRIDPMVETQLFRIVSEGVSNALRHAEATAISIDLSTTDTTLRVVISDDGKGFDVGLMSTMIRTGHFGLAGMRERIEVLGGTALVESSERQGTTLTFDVPLEVSASAELGVLT